MTRRSRLTPKQRDELRAYLCDGAAFAALRAQSYDPKGSAGAPEDDGVSDRQLSLGRAHQRVHLALQRVAEIHRGVLALSYGPKARDDRHGGRHEEEIAPLLRMTDLVQMEATGRWIAAERKRLIDRGAPEDIVVQAPAFDATRSIATEVIGENRPAIMVDGDEVYPGAITQARSMLDAAELAYLVAVRECERAKTDWVDDREYERPMVHPVSIDPCRQRKREREAKEGAGR